MLIYEKIITKHFLAIKRYREKLIFIGKIQVLGLVLLGITGYWHLTGTKYQPPILTGLGTIMATAKLDDRQYKVTDWNHKQGRLFVYVEKEIPRVKNRSHASTTIP